MEWHHFWHSKQNLFRNSEWNEWVKEIPQEVWNGIFPRRFQPETVLRFRTKILQRFQLKLPNPGVQDKVPSGTINDFPVMRNGIYPETRNEISSWDSVSLLGCNAELPLGFILRKWTKSVLWCGTECILLILEGKDFVLKRGTESYLEFGTEAHV